MYVDPIRGDDELAWLSNPQRAGPPAQRPLADYPMSTFPDPGGANGSAVLQHAPYSFRTLTRAHGAMAWIDTTFFKDANNQPVPLPWCSPDHPLRCVRWIVVHCLPGLYGPEALANVDPASQLTFNNEAFPVRLPRGVSLQGTSALDTIFDARFSNTSIIETGQYVDGFGSAPQPSYFIDSLTIRNARSNGLSGSIGMRNNSGAGIYAATDSGPTPMHLPLTISNCFLVDNNIGVAFDGQAMAPEEQGRPIVIHNTFAYNRVGLWNGWRFGGNQGNTILNILDNIFDTRHPDPNVDANETQRSPFQGIAPGDLIVTATNPPAPGVSALSFNAWHQGRENIGVSVIVTNFPQPSNRAGFVPMPLPRVDIGPYMGTATRPRGILYLADAFRAAGSPNLSPHDLRLSPHSAVDPTLITPSNPITALNPLVDKGIDAGETMTRFTSIQFQNDPPPNSVTTTLIDQPGFTPATQIDPDRFHCWDFDTEGFGNPRIRRGFGACSDPVPFGLADLGADELDGLIMAGYVPSTRMFAVLPTVPTVTTQTTVYFFALRGSTYPRPFFTALLGEQFNWWQHTRSGHSASDAIEVITPTGLYKSNYTDAITVPPGGNTPSWRGLLIRPTSGPITVPPGLPGGINVKPPIMRNLECDFAPVLLSDWRPLWRWWFNNPPNVKLDVYVSNPWFGDTQLAVSGSQTNDNFHCYRNPTHPNISGIYRSGLIEGSLNAPGTYWNGSAVECGNLPSYILPGAQLGIFGPYPSCASSSITIGPFGYGNDAPCGPDVLPLIVQWQGIRFDCQFASNLQTFLIVIGDSSFTIAGDGNSVVAASTYSGSRAGRDSLPVSTRSAEELPRMFTLRRWPR